MKKISRECEIDYCLKKMKEANMYYEATKENNGERAKIGQKEGRSE